MIRIIRKNLIVALTLTGKAVKKSPLPILENVLLQHADNVLTVSGTDLDTIIQVKVGAVGTFDNTTVNRAALLKLVKSSTDDVIELWVDVDKLRVDTRASHYTMPTISADEYPLLDGTLGADTVYTANIDPLDLRRVADEIAVAAATDAARPSLTGVCTVFESNALNLAATDGFRLHTDHVSVTDDQNNLLTTSLIIPARLWADAAATFKKSTEPVVLSIRKSGSGWPLIVFSDDAVTVAARAVDGRFPSYEPIIPKSHNHAFRVNAADLQAVAKSAANINILGNKSSVPLVFSYRPVSGKKLALSIKYADDLSEWELEIAVTDHLDMYYDEPVDFAVSPVFMADALIGQSNVTVEWNTKNEPIVVNCGPKSKRIVMPMNFDRR